MKIISALLVSLICIQLYACSKNEEIVQTNNSNNTSNTDTTNNTSNIDTTKMKITIGTNIFTATLYNNATAAAFKAKLPMTINMTELNGNEKFVDFSDGLPANASNPGSIQAGDLMMYGSRTLVFFYVAFSTSYSYTRLGRIDNPSGLATVLGTGNVTVKFESQ
ncbi:MAG: cyclophilin-like fold protein [Ferruginibacter sp.]